MRHLTRNQIAGLASAERHRIYMRRTGLTHWGNRVWRPEEDDFLRAWHLEGRKGSPTLPGRTEKAVDHRRKRLGLVTPKAKWTEAQIATVKPRYPTTEPVAAIAADVEKSRPQVWKKGSQQHWRRPRIPPRQVADPLTNAIRQRAFALRISLKELDAACGAKGRLIRGVPIAPLTMAANRALAMLGGEVVLL